MSTLEEGAFSDLLEDAVRCETNTVTRRARLVFRTDHLRNFQALDDLIALESSDYIPIMKGVWYSIHGALKSKPVFFGNIITDTRFHLQIPLPSGSGKGNISYGITEIIEAVGKDIRQPSTFHPEQLIGKVIKEQFFNPEKGKNGAMDVRWVPNYGYLRNRYLIFNEAYQFITENDKLYEESRSHITKALDPIGRNKVYKRLIDHLDVPEQRLEYYPQCTISMFLQPRQIEEHVVLSGFIRRYLCLYVPMVGKNLDRVDEMEAYIKKPRTEGTFEYWKDIADWSAPAYFNFDDGVADLIVVLHRDLVAYMRGIGEKERNYLDRNTFALVGHLIKMATIQAISKKSNIVTQEDIKLAYMDLFEFFRLTLDYVAAKVYGTLDYGEKWHGADAKEIDALQWLVERGALGEKKSETTVKEWLNHLMELFEVGSEAARKHHQKLRNKRGLIDSKQVGSDSSRVWITFDPDQEDILNGDPVHLEDTIYWQIAQTPPYHPTALTTLPPDSENDDTTLVPPSPDSDFGDEKREGVRVVTWKIRFWTIPPLPPVHQTM